MPRLIKTQTQFEGRFEETWTLVEESDELPAWEEDARLTVVGTPRPRQDGGLRAAGGARYTVDVDLPGMLRAAVLRSPHAHARLVSIELDAARAVPGVRAAVGPGDELVANGRPLLTADVEYVGAPVAAIAADTDAAAAAGVRALAPQWEVLPFSISVDEAIAEQRFRGEPEEVLRGDVDAALARADARIEFALETPGHLQTPLEPHGAVAWWQEHELTAWVSTQGMFSARDELCRRFGIERERVRVRTDYVGGGFGGKQGAGPEALLATALSRLTRRPVRVVNDRHAEQLVGGRRAATRQSVRLGASRDGRLVAVDADALVAIGASGPRMPVLTPAMTLYHCDDVRGLLFPLKVNLAPSNAFRAPGVMEGTACMEQAMDVLAARARARPAGAAAPQPRGRRPDERRAVLRQGARRLHDARGRARRLGRPRPPARAAARRPAARHGLCAADLVGLGQPACARHDPPRLRRHRRW